MVDPSLISSRLRRFQSKLKELSIDCAMIRTLSDFKYLLGLKWLRPAVLVPAEGVPKVFLARGEEAGFMERVAVKELELITYSEGGELMSKVTGTIRSLGAKRVGMVFSVERDSYSLLYELFKKANRDAEVVDIGPVLSELRAVKDDYELECIRRAGDLASKVLERALNSVRVGVSETEIAAEAYYEAFRSGCEEPHIYVNCGPHPRVHSEPSKYVKVSSNTLVTVVVATDYGGYYANTSSTTYVGTSPPETISNALKCAKEVYQRAYELTKPGVIFAEIMRDLDEVYRKYRLIGNRLLGYVHGVGLQPEEFPITTIVAAHRAKNVAERMALAFVHTPIMLPGYGSVKFEDTYLVLEGKLVKVSRAAELL